MLPGMFFFFLERKAENYNKKTSDVLSDVLFWNYCFQSPHPVQV